MEVGQARRHRLLQYDGEKGRAEGAGDSLDYVDRAGRLAHDGRRQLLERSGHGRGDARAQAGADEEERSLWSGRLRREYVRRRRLLDGPTDVRRLARELRREGESAVELLRQGMGDYAIKREDDHRMRRR